MARLLHAESDGTTVYVQIMLNTAIHIHNVLSDLLHLKDFRVLLRGSVLTCLQTSSV